MHFFDSDAAAAAAAKSLQSCLTLCDPIDGSPPGSPIPGILQARTLEWVGISFSTAWKWKVKLNSLSCVWLFLTPWTAAYQAPPSMGFSRQEYWSGVPLPSPDSDATLFQYILQVLRQPILWNANLILSPIKYKKYIYNIFPLPKEKKVWTLKHAIIKLSTISLLFTFLELFSDALYPSFILLRPCQSRSLTNSQFPSTICYLCWPDLLLLLLAAISYSPCKVDLKSYCFVEIRWWSSA